MKNKFLTQHIRAALILFGRLTNLRGPIVIRFSNTRGLEIYKSACGGFTYKCSFGPDDRIKDNW